MPSIKVDRECPGCNGTGLYVGMGERDGWAVQCHICKGTGKDRFILNYEEFTGRKEREGVRIVLQANPGICVGGDLKGGKPYADWKRGEPFRAGEELRDHTCPAWFYQSADYEKKPDWKECDIFGTFSSCRHFPNKSDCWKRWDKEQDVAGKD